MPHTADSWWEIDVSGEKGVLAFLAESLGDSDQIVLTQGENGGYLLHLPALNPSPDAGVVRSHARATVARLAGAAQLLLGWPTPLEIGHVRRRHPDGRADYFLEVDSVRVAIRTFPVTLRVTRADGTVEQSSPGEELSNWLEAAAKRPSVARALRLIAEPDPSWVELYRILEIVHEDAGGRFNAWISNAEHENFRRTANSVDAVGDAARHGRERWQPPANPMRLDDARRLVLRVVKNWLNDTSANP